MPPCHTHHQGHKVYLDLCFSNIQVWLEVRVGTITGLKENNLNAEKKILFENLAQQSFLIRHSNQLWDIQVLVGKK